MTPDHDVAPLPITVDHDGVRLAGTLWVPAGAVVAVVLMHPGSGPSDRDNDVYFPPIRQWFLRRGMAVGSFDKRGVGESTGDWLTARIGVQAADASACLDQLADRLPGIPRGIFGHSQGGWVVVELAAARPDVAFVIANSAPGVTPAAQERYATTGVLAERAGDPQEFAAALRCFDLATTCMATGIPIESAAEIIRRAGLEGLYRRSDLFSFPIDDPALWDFAASILDHDPRPALRKLAVPALAVFGGEDRAVPVDASVAVYSACVAPELLTVAVVDGADHRVEIDDRLPEQYFAALDQFLDRVID